MAPSGVGRKAYRTSSRTAVAYHLPRAVATCRALGIRAEGVGDVSVRRFGGAWLQGAVRDQVACVKTVLDLATRRQPVLGPPETSVAEALTLDRP